jgi:hypothetical protein
MIVEIVQTGSGLSLNPINRWEWVFPVVESIHICGFALLVGTIAVLDLRLSDLVLPCNSSPGRICSRLPRTITLTIPRFA